MSRLPASLAFVLVLGLFSGPMAATVERHSFEGAARDKAGEHVFEEDALFLEDFEEEHAEGKDEEDGEAVEEEADGQHEEDDEELTSFELSNEEEEGEEEHEQEDLDARQALLIQANLATDPEALNEEEDSEEDEVSQGVDDEPEEDASLLETHEEHEEGEGEDDEEEEHEEDEGEQEAQEREAEDELEPDAEHSRDEELPQEVAASLLEGEEFLIDSLEGEEGEEQHGPSEEDEAADEAFCCFASSAKTQPDLCSQCYGNSIEAEGSIAAAGFHGMSYCVDHGGSWCEAGTGPTVALAEDEVEEALIHHELYGELA